MRDQALKKWRSGANRPQPCFCTLRGLWPVPECIWSHNQNSPIGEFTATSQPEAPELSFGREAELLELAELRQEIVNLSMANCWFTAQLLQETAAHILTAISTGD